MRALLLTIGLVLLAAGLGLGLFPASATSTYGDQAYSCGSPWIADQGALERQQTVNDMASALSAAQGLAMPIDNAAAKCPALFGSRGVFGGVLAGLGALTLLGLGLVVAAQRQPPAAAGPSGEAPAA